MDNFYYSIFSLASIVILLPFLILILLLKDKNKQLIKTPSLPPGPPKLPLIGNMYQLIGKIPHHSLFQLSKKYGPAMLLHRGHVPTLVVSSAETAREVLKTHDLHCCKAILTGPKRLSYDSLDVGFCPYSDYWREMRKILVLEFLCAKKLHSFQFIREEEVAQMINSFSLATPSPVNLSEELLSLTNRIVGRAAFGKSYFGMGIFDSGRRFQEVMSEAQIFLRFFSMADLIPSVGWVIDRLTGFHARLEKSFRELDAFHQQIIDDHLDPNRQKPDDEDIVDVLLGLEGDEVGGIRLTKDHIKAVLMNILLAGMEPSAVIMVSAMVELAKNPKMMNKLQKEIRQCVGSKGKVEESDLNQLLYLKMVVKETLRLHTPGAFLIPRETIRHFKIDGYDIYPKTTILVNNWAMSRDPNYWDCPEEFLQRDSWISPLNSKDKIILSSCHLDRVEGGVRV